MTSDPAVPPRRSTTWYERANEVRGRLRLGDADIARGLKLPKTKFSKVTRWLNGDAAARFEDVATIADMLGVSLDWLAGRIPAPDATWSDEDLVRLLKTFGPEDRKIVEIAADPRGRAWLARAADQYREFERSRAR